MFRAEMTFKLKSIVVLLDILCIPAIICSPVKDYEFVKEARDAPAERRYDYIIVGGGTAGCPLAATLSQNFSVLLLERGGSPYGNINISRIENFYLSLADVSASSPSQKFVSEDGVISTRGRVLGGSSCLNAGFYSRASPDYVRSVGWDGELVNRSYGWVEKLVAYRPNVPPWQSAVRDALLDVGISPYNGFTYDHLYGTKVGGTTFDANGDRRTAADLLEYANPRNLLVLLHATVHRVLFTTRGKSRPVADGVMYRDADGVEHVAYLKVRDKEVIQSEIIISAGALGSPQLLLLSGIGPAEHLKSLGIPVVVDRPAVGEGMADNPMNAIYIPTTKPVEMSLIQVVGITKFGSYIEASSGIHHSKYGTMAPSEAQEKGQPLWGGFVLEKVEGPLSRGRLVLRNADVDDNPSVAFKYFDDPRDLRRCVEGITTIEKMIRSRGLAEFTYPKVSFAQLREISSRVLKNLIPKHTNDSTSLEQFCRDTVTTIWHYHGGCHVERVVDRRYRVLGVDALRVIDGSTFNSSPGTNPQATVMMLGRYMGVTILKERLGAAASI